MLQGAFCTILSTTLAASIAYTVAQGLGKNFAKKLIDREVGEALGKEGNAAQRVRSNCRHDAVTMAVISPAPYQDSD